MTEVIASVSFPVSDATYAKWTPEQINAQIAKLLSIKPRAWATNEAAALGLVAKVNDHNAFDGWGFQLLRFQGQWWCGCRVEQYQPEFKTFRVCVVRDSAARALAEICLHWLQNAAVGYD